MLTISAALQTKSASTGAFNQEKALAGAFSVIVQPVVEPMDYYTALSPEAGGEKERRGVIDINPQQKTSLKTDTRHDHGGGNGNKFSLTIRACSPGPLSFELDIDL